MKYYIVLILLLLLLTSMVSAQEPVSFRNNALGGVINDNLDLIYDPIELRFVDSLRIYTNLSNLTSTREQIFNNYSDNELLLGVSRQNPMVKNLWTSALVRIQKFDYASPVSINSDLNGFRYVYGEGTLRDEYTEYIDLGIDGLYDLKRMISQKKSRTQNVDGYSFIINNTYLLNEYTMGLKISYSNRNIQNNTASMSLGTGKYDLFGSLFTDPTFDRSVDEYYLDSNYSRLKWSENGNFLTEFKSPSFNMLASLMLPVSYFELRGDLKFYTISNSIKVKDLYSGVHERFVPSITDYKRKYNENDNYLDEEETSGLGYGLGASIRHIFDKKANRINEGYWLIGISFIRESFDYNYLRKQNFYSDETVFDGITGPLTDFVEKKNNLYNISDDGDGSRNILSLNGKINVPLLDAVYFGIGGYYSIYWLSRETKYFSDSKQFTDYMLTDNISNYSDYKRTTSINLEANRTFETTAYVYTIPVGVEYLFTENRRWAIRFGSIFNYYSEVVKDAIQITDSKPYTIKTERGDGSVEISYNTNAYSSVSESKSISESQTLFTYGLGFKATDNLQIDLLGFFDVQNNITLLEYFKYLRISLALKI